MEEIEDIHKVCARFVLSALCSIFLCVGLKFVVQCYGLGKVCWLC